MQIIGITGGIGSGKSTIARALAARGYAMYDCDKEAKRIIAENKDVQQKIIELLGEEAFTNPSAPSLEERAGGEVSPIYNTSYVAQRVFAEPELLEKLNHIVHPAVKEDICQQALPAVCQQSGLSAKRSISKAVLFIESAILYEAGLDSLCDKIVVIEAPEDIRIARSIARDYHGDASPENINKVRARIRAQGAVCLPPGQACIRHQMVVQNDGKRSIDELVADILQNL